MRQWKCSAIRRTVLAAAVLLVFSSSYSQNPSWKTDLGRVAEWSKAGECGSIAKTGALLEKQIPRSAWEARAELSYYRSTCTDDTTAFHLLMKADSLYSGNGKAAGPVFALSQAALGRRQYKDEEDPVIVRKHLDNALRAWLSESSPDSLEMATVIEYLGRNAKRQAEYIFALDMFRQARAIHAAHFGEVSLKVALTDMNLGNTYYTMDRYEDALDAYQLALATIRLTDPGRDGTIANLLNNIAATQDQLHRYEEAVGNYKAALSLIRKRVGEGDIHTIVAFGNIGLVYHRMGNEAEAVKYTRKAAEMATKAMDPNDQMLGEILGDFAYVQAENGQYEEALRLLQQAILAFAPSSIARDWRSNPDLEDVLRHEQFRNAITYKAQVLTRLADTASRPEPLLRLAMDCYDLFAASLDQVWQEFTDPGDKLYLNKNGVNEYERAIACAARLWEVTGDENWKAKIFEFMERGKCQVQLESIRRSRASYLAGIPAGIRKRGAKLREEINELFYQQSVGNAAEVGKRLTEKRIELDRFNDSLQLVFPGYAQMTGHKSLVPLATVQERLTDPSTCILEYFLGDSTLYVIGTSKHGNTFRQTSLPPNFSDSLQLFFRFMQYPHPIANAVDPYRRLGSNLFRILLEPELKSLPESVNRLRIIPDGQLSLLPFDALPSGPGPDNPRSHGELPLLIFDYRVSYAGSAALLAGLKPSENQAVECLGFAWNGELEKNEASTTRSIMGQEWPALPGASREMAAIRRKVSGAYFSGNEATEQAFKLNAGQFGLLHLALHGYSGGEEPFILFPERGDSTEDGILYLHELYNLPLRARLAVLSACETGSGNLQRGEGVMSVASGFGSAGCPSVVMSVWPVDDQAGNRIMRYFYDGLLEGMPVDEALHQAKISFINSGGSYRAAPYYWAPFFALGDVSPIAVSRRSSYWAWWLFLGGMVVLGFLIFLFWRRRRGAG